LKGLGLAAPVSGVAPTDLRMRRAWGAEQPWVIVAAPAAPKAKKKAGRR